MKFSHIGIPTTAEKNGGGFYEPGKIHDTEFTKDDNVLAIGGSWSVKRELVLNENWSEITARAVAVRQIADEVRIPEIMDFEVALNIGAYGASFLDVSLIATYADEAAFRRYCVYPEHDAVVACIQSVTAAEAIVDYRL